MEEASLSCLQNNVNKLSDSPIPMLLYFALTITIVFACQNPPHKPPYLNHGISVSFFNKEWSDHDVYNGSLNRFYDPELPTLIFIYGLASGYTNTNKTFAFSLSKNYPEPELAKYHAKDISEEWNWQPSGL